MPAKKIKKNTDKRKKTASKSVSKKAASKAAKKAGAKSAKKPAAKRGKPASGRRRKNPLKELAPVRMMKNKFFNQVQDLYKKAPTPGQLKELLGRARAKRGMFEGDLEDGELEIGQIAGLIHEIKSVSDIVDEIVEEFEVAKFEVSSL